MKNTLTILFMLLTSIVTSQNQSECDSILTKDIFAYESPEDLKMALSKFIECNSLDPRVDLAMLSIEIIKLIDSPSATFNDLLNNYSNFQKTDEYQAMYLEMKTMDKKYETLSKTIATKLNWDENESIMVELGWKDLESFKNDCSNYLKHNENNKSYLVLHQEFNEKKQEQRAVEKDIKAKVQIANSAPYPLCSSASYADILHLPHQLKGYYKYNEGIECSKLSQKPVLLMFTGHGSVDSREMEALVFSDPDVLQLMNDDFVITVLYVDDKTRLPVSEYVKDENNEKILKTIGKINAYFQKEKFKNTIVPAFYILDSNGNLLCKPYFYNLSTNKFKKFLSKGLKTYKD